MTTLWIRADLSPSIGLGHVSRCCAVAEEWTRRGSPAVVVSAGDLPPHLRRCVSRLSPPDEWETQVRPRDAVLVDGYRFDERDVPRAAGALIVTFDDGVGGVEADVTIRPAGPVQATDSLLSGPHYAPVRASFRDHRRLRQGGAGTLLLTLGGGEGPSWERSVLSLATASPFRHLLQLKGPLTSGEEVASEDGLEVARFPGDPATAFDRGDAALTAAGNTVWELLTMGLPLVLLISADNQERIAAVVSRAGAAAGAFRPDGLEGLPSALEKASDPAVQRGMSAAALDVTDGWGCKRIVDAITRRIEGGVL